ncbi:hypothetical protein N8819_03265 [Gammaproteobacteria bacterium]|nr:hypothetical protein [Gammaproteobacteria bacterium]MDC1377503.1 hypothetical protein [Gammaproteobacteria bacterium]
MKKEKSIQDTDINDDLPSAADDCADVTSKYDKYIKDLNKPKFPPIDYERPPHF